MSVTIFPGTFNPFTIGHLSILRRGLKLFDRVVVVLGVNDAKPTDSDADRRLEQVKNAVAGLKGVDVICWSGLTAEAARKVGADAILRGARSVADFEYERSMADVNRELFGIETVVLFAEPEMAMVSSSMVRELQRFGVDVSRFLPQTSTESL